MRVFLFPDIARLLALESTHITIIYPYLCELFGSQINGDKNEIYSEEGQAHNVGKLHSYMLQMLQISF